MTTPITGQGLNVCIPPDDELSSTSKKAAQNKVITEEFTNVSNAIGELNRQLSDLEDTVSTTQIINTASGAIASFDDGADSMPIRKLVAQIEPVQDLHGQDSPYPAGGGRNKLDPRRAVKGLGYNSPVGTTFTPATADKQWTDKGNGVFEIDNLDTWEQAGFYSDVLPSGSVWMSINNVTGNLKGTIYVCDENFTVNRISSIGNPISDGSTFFVQTTFSGTDARVVIYLAGNSEKAHIEKPCIYTGSDTSDTSYSPYENLCPISGHTGAEITQRGVNIWDEEWDIGYVDLANGNFQSTPQYVRSKHKFDITGGKSYRATCTRSGTLGNFGICFYDANGGFLLGATRPANSTFTAPDGSAQMAFFVPSSWYTGDYANDISINYPSTDTAYHAYTGNQISVDWEDEGGTVYGGTATINEDGNVNVSNTAESYDLSTLSWTLMGACDGGNRFFANPDMSRLPDLYRVNLPICGCLKTINPIKINEQSPVGLCGVYVNGNNRFIMITYAADSVSDLVAKLGAYQANERVLVTPFVTPIDYTLEAVEPVATLYGTNNIWADVGPVSVEYCADTKLYIDGKLAELQATILENIGG